MDLKRESVIKLYLAGKSQKKIVSELKHLKLNKWFVHRTIKRYNETGSIEKRHGGGRKRTATSEEMVQKVKTLIDENPTLSARKIAAKLGISNESTQRILKNELGLKAHKRQEIVKDLTMNENETRTTENEEPSTNI